MQNKFKYRLIIGLGNPGPGYDLTYHNVGSLAVNHLLRITTAAMTLIQKGEKKNFEFVKFANNQSLIFIKPLTFMNDSGKAVSAALKYFKIKPEKMLVIHDDSDINLGKMKLSFGRGAAGHHGVESIISNLKTKNFWRLRIGIGKEKEKASGFVLKKITPTDKFVLERLFNDLKIL